MCAETGAGERTYMFARIETVACEGAYDGMELAAPAASLPTLHAI